MPKVHKLKDIHIKKENITLDINMSRMERNLNRAQYALDSAVMHSMVPYMPMQTGTFINVTRGMSQAIAGSGKVYAAAPTIGSFLYEGKVMVGERTRSAWAARGEKKISTDRPIRYSRHAHPKVTDHWFEKAKEMHLHDWEKVVSREMEK